MRAFVRGNQDAEVGIDRSQDPVVIDRPSQDRSITRVVAQLDSLDGVVPLIPQPLRKARASAAVEEQSHPSADFDGVEGVVCNDRASIREACLDISARQARVVGQDAFDGLALREQAQDQLDRDPHPADDRLATEDLAIRRDARKQLSVVHDLSACSLSKRRELEGLRARHEALTDREREVLALVVAGLLNKVIADRLGIQESTIKVHRGRVMEKMAAASLADLVRMSERLGLAPDTDPARR